MKDAARTTFSPLSDCAPLDDDGPVGEMRRSWKEGHRVRVETILERIPELWSRTQEAIDLVYEEYCLRSDLGELGVEQDLLRRFPQWADAIGVMLDCHRRVLASRRDAPVFPAGGERVGEFTLLEELARGAHGRVFLATQAGLADRRVVLKITPLEGGEHISLARLQHTNIVPLYSVMDDHQRGLRVLCMPYFGATTLSSVLEALRDVPMGERTGRHIVELIDGSDEGSLSTAAKQMLERLSFVQAMSWIGACLADALGFAHERGVVHLDLKPSNVLLASDGQPMLLDFHLARAPIAAGGSTPEHFGGTTAYMAPEQRALMEAMRDGRELQGAVDGRTDIYALGMILHEAMGGRLPVEGDPLHLVELNPQVSAGLSDIVQKCLARRPADRYGDSQSLADDLRRHLTDQPLAGVPNRSIRERWQKWRRRRPGRLRAAAMLLVAAGATAALIMGSRVHLRDRHDATMRALADGQKQLEAGNSAESVRSFETASELARAVPWAGDLQARVAKALVHARRKHLAHELHGLAEQVRMFYGEAESIPSGHLAALAERCATFRAKCSSILGSANAADRALLAEDFQDVAIFVAGLQARLSVDERTGRREALGILEEAAQQFGDSAVLEHERATHRMKLGMPAFTTVLSPKTAWEHYALGRAFMEEGDLSRAQAELRAAVRLDPGEKWANFYLGLCAYRKGEHHRAVEALSVCIGGDARIAGFFYNRALAHAATGDAAKALEDLERALQLEPAHAGAARTRASLQAMRHDSGAGAPVNGIRPSLR